MPEIADLRKNWVRPTVVFIGCDFHEKLLESHRSEALMVHLLFAHSDSSPVDTSFSTRNIEMFWSLMALVVIINLVVIIIQEVRRPEPSADSLTNDDILQILRDLAADIKYDVYTEARMIAWLEHARDLARPPIWDDGEAEEFGRAILEVADAMDAKRWDSNVPAEFLLAIRAASATDIGFLRT